MGAAGGGGADWGLIELKKALLASAKAGRLAEAIAAAEEVVARAPLDAVAREVLGHLVQLHGLRSGDAAGTSSGEEDEGGEAGGSSEDEAEEAAGSGSEGEEDDGVIKSPKPKPAKSIALKHPAHHGQLQKLKALLRGEAERAGEQAPESKREWTDRLLK